MLTCLEDPGEMPAEVAATMAIYGHMQPYVPIYIHTHMNIYIYISASPEGNGAQNLGILQLTYLLPLYPTE